jgi:hypothetical protein
VIRQAAWRKTMGKPWELWGCHGIFTSKMVIHWDFCMIEPTKLGDLGIEEQS